VVVREARKVAAEAISEVFAAARRSVRRLRRQTVLDLAPTTSKTFTAGAQILTH